MLLKKKHGIACKLEIEPKAKEKVISKEIKKLNMEFDICIINTKNLYGSLLKNLSLSILYLRVKKIANK